MRRGVRSARALLAMLLAPASEPTAGSAIRGNMTSHVAPRAISSCLALRGDGNAALAGSFNARAPPGPRRSTAARSRARPAFAALGRSRSPRASRRPPARAPTRSLPRILARRRGASGRRARRRRRRGGGGDARGRDREARRAVLPGRRPRDLGRRLRPTARAFGGAGGGAPGGEAPRQPHGTRRREKRGRRRRFRARKLFGRRREGARAFFRAGSRGARRAHAFAVQRVHGRRGARVGAESKARAGGRVARRSGGDEGDGARRRVFRFRRNRHRVRRRAED